MTIYCRLCIPTSVLPGFFLRKRDMFKNFKEKSGALSPKTGHRQNINDHTYLFVV